MMNQNTISKGGPLAGVANVIIRGLIFLALICSMPSLEAQFPVAADLPDLRLTRGGQVYAIALQDDGKLIIVGDFFEVNGVPRRNLARLNSDGSVDPTWTTGTDALVLAVAVQGNDVLIGGAFEEVGGEPRRYLAKLDGANGGAVVPGWAPDPDDFAVTFDFHGSHVYIGGWFSNIGGQAIKGLARADLGSGVIDPTWDPQVDDRVYIVEADDPHIFAGGEFLNAGGQARRRLAKIALADASIESWNPGANDFPRTLLVEGSDLYVGGTFTEMGGLGRNRLARVDVSTGSVDPVWNPDVNAQVFDLALDGDSVIAVGLFFQVGAVGSENVAKISVLGTGVAESLYGEDFTNSVYSVASSGSALYVGGIFETVSGIDAGPVVRLTPEFGRLDGTFQMSAISPGEISDLKRQVDGKLLVGGSFSRVGGVARNNLLRLNVDGTVDAEWAPNPNRSVTALEVYGTEVYVGGNFSTIGGQTRISLARLSSTGTDAADPDWDPELLFVDGSFVAIGVVADIVVSDEAVYVGGDFNYCGGQFRSAVAKLDKVDGLAFTDWNPLTSNDGDVDVFSLALDGPNLYVGGEFTSIGNYVPQPRKNIAKLTTGTAEALFWNPAPDTNAQISTIEVDGAGVYVGGFFSQIGGQTRSNLARLSKTTAAADPTWVPEPNNEVYTLLADPEGVYIGGVFTVVSGQPRNAIAKIMSDGSVDPDWNPDANGGVQALELAGKDTYVAGFFNEVGGENRSGLAFLPIPDAPTLVATDASTVQLLRSPLDGEEIMSFRILSVTGGSLQRPGGEELSAGDFVSVEEGAAGLSLGLGATITVAAAVRSEIAATGLETSSITMTAGTPPPVFAFVRSRVEINEGSALLVVEVEKLAGGAASVDYSISAETATVGLDVGPPSGGGTMAFGAGDTLKVFSVPLVDDFVTEGDETFQLNLSNPGGGGALAFPGRLTVSIIDNDLVGDPSSYLVVTQPTPLDPGPSDGVLEVDISGDSDLGQWRLLGESEWRDSVDDGGAPVTDLSTGNYTVEFKPVDGLREPVPIRFPIDGSVATPVGLTAAYTVQDLFNPGEGSLSVRIEPEAVSDEADESMRGQWRRVGDATWRDSGDAVSVVSGVHEVEFKSIPGSITPESLTVYVQADQENTTGGIYFRETVLGAVVEPVPLPFDAGSPGEAAVTEAPYLFNGQIFTDIGYGSGVVVREHTVLTAAHVLFDDLSLSQVTNVGWLHQRHRGSHEPPPQHPRGWYRFDGYAAQREIDVADPLIGSGVGSPESQNLDVAVMYFLDDAGRGGEGGYLSSDDQGANPWLVSVRDKFLVGYPVEEVSSATRGQMHATPASTLSYTHVQNFVFKTNDLKTTPGNSGGPVYVRADNGIFYPAGIYLGGTGESIVRAIDSAVVDLINLGEVAGSGGGNGTGGGRSRTSPGYTEDTLDRGQVTVRIGGADGGRWRIVDSDGEALSDYVDSMGLLQFASGDVFVELEPIVGRETPEKTSATIYASQTTNVPLAYIEDFGSWTQTELLDQGVTSGIGPLDDYDQDSIVHLLEYAFNLSPILSDFGILDPGISKSGLPSISLVRDGNAARFRFEYVRRRSATAPNLRYYVEIAPSPDGPWLVQSDAEELSEIDGTWERVITETGDLLGLSPAYFGRVRVEEVPE